MELDVHLTREGDEWWGLQLFGGDNGDLFTIAQVDPESPAHLAGLQPGDTVTRIGYKLSRDLSPDAARSLLAEAVGSLAFGVCRGLYDPVLNDFESIYEPHERADSDLPSEPTEVSPPRYVEYPEHPLSELDFQPITDSRSLTASPFLTNTKPYRPFSTEPLPTSVPPLEDPIILNSEFKDDFGEILQGIDIDNVETKYKLQVSQQYDPSYRKKVDGILEKSVEREKTVCFEKTEASEVKIDECNVKHDVMQTKIVEETYQDELLSKEEAKFDEEMKLEIDMVNIERTAIDIVEESIERAVSVTKEIKEIVEEELRASETREIVKEKKNNEISEHKESEFMSEVIQSEIKDEVVQECKAKQIIVDESEVSENQPRELLYVRENKHKTKTHEVKTDMTEFVKNEYDDTKVKREPDCKQNAFNVGLQTIPNIRGMAQSSYHFDLLMRTFFIHLTDVMVAISRFILTQPALQLEVTAEKVINDQLIVGLRNESLKSKTHSSQSQQTQARKDVEVKHEYKVKENIESQMKQEMRSESRTQEHLEFEEMEQKRLSGVEMAQRTQRKSKELTNIMDAVISEFETKTGIEDRLEVTERSRRSRSRSRIEEEVMNESDPLEWLAKVDKQSQVSTNITTSKKTSSQTESKETKRSERESRETRTSTPRSEKQMYVAVVESHVYTNKDAILQEMLETSSNESTEDISMAVELKSVEKQQAVEVITQALESNVVATAESSVVSSESRNELLNVKESRIETASTTTEESFKTAAVEISQDSLEAFKEFTELKINKQEAIEAEQELLTSVASETTQADENLKTKSFNVFEMSEKTVAITSEENYKATAIQSTETLLEESREEKTELKISEKHATSKVDLAIAVAGSTDIVNDDSIAEIFEATEIQSKTAVIREEETFKTAAVETTEVTLEEAIEEHAVTLQTGHATIRESKNLAVAGIIETKTQEDKIKIPKPTEDEFASLKIIKQEIIDDETIDVQVTESEFTSNSLKIQNHVSETSMFQSEKLHIQTDLTQTITHDDSDINTPTPSTVPPTPLTDEYVFKLQIPLPKHTGPVITEENSDHEDLSIVKRKLIPHIEATVDETIIYDPPLPTPDDKNEPVYTKLGLNGGSFVYVKPGLRGGANLPCYRREYIREIERKSSLLASAIDQTIKCIEEYKEEVGIDRIQEEVTNSEEETIEEEDVRPEDELIGFKTVHFEPDSLPIMTVPLNIPVMPASLSPQPYVDASGLPLGSVEGIIDGLKDPLVNEQLAKELGKPGLTEDKIAELISGESEMLREAHVMGLTRVISTHMNKPDGCSVDFNKIKPLVESLKNSEVLAALNAEFMKTKEERQKDDRKWTTFLQKPQRPTPRVKHGYYGYLPQEEHEQGPYKVKIVKQPKPKVAPDYKPEDFETGPLPWEERALTEPPPPPVALEDPILVPEDSPEFFEAVDPLPESSVPDLQDTGIILPPPRAIEEITEELQEPTETPPVEEATEEVPHEKEEEEDTTEMKGEVEEMAEQLVQNVKSMVDPNAPIQQQLAQMRAQLAALAQLPCVIQQSLELLTNHLANISQQEACKVTCESQVKAERFEEVELRVIESAEHQMACESDEVGHVTVEEIGAGELNENTIQEEVPETKITLTAEEYAALKREEEILIEEQLKNDKLKKVQERIEQESRQLKHRAAPRVGKPKMFGPQNPEVRPLVLPGGRRWKGPKDVFNDQFIAETLQAQSEVIQGKVMGINFMKYEKPPVSLDHLQHSDVYKAVHGMAPATRRVDLLTPVVAEADYRERCRSMTPTARVEEHLDMPEQLQP